MVIWGIARPGTERGYLLHESDSWQQRHVLSWLMLTCLITRQMPVMLGPGPSAQQPTQWSQGVKQGVGQA